MNIYDIQKLKKELKNKLINDEYKINEMKIIYNNLFINN